jgi:CDP-glycerol glycerophosphotransferase
LKNEKYWEILRSVFLELLQSAPKDILGSIPPQQIIPLGLLAENRILDLADFRSIDGYRKGTFPLEKIKNKWRLTGVNSRFESKLSAQHAIMPEDRLKLVHQMRSAYWTRTNIPELVITGFCYLEQVDTCSTEFERILEFRDRDGMTVLTVHGNESEDEDLIPGQSATGVSYARAGVIFSIPLTDFERVIPQNSRRKDLDVYFVLRSGSFTSSTRVTNFSAWSNAGELPVASNKNGIKVDANFRDGSFRVRLNRIDYEVFRIDAIGSEAIIHVRSLTTVPSPSALQIHHASSGEKISVSRIDEADEQGSNTNISGWKVDFSTEDGELYRKGIYEVRALREDGLGTPIAYYPSDQSPIWMESKMRARPSARGNLTFIRESSKGLIKSLDVLPNGKVVVVFTLFSEVPFKQPILHFKGRGQETDEILAELQDDGSFSAEVPVAITKFALAQFPKRGAFNLVLQVEVDGSKQSIPLVLTQPVRDNLPRRTYLSQSMLVLLPSPSNHLHLSIRPALRANERTNFNQHRMKKTLQSSSEIEPAFLFRSYFGENVSCNGLAVAKELLSRGVSFPIYAAVQDQSVLVPDGIRPVLVGSERWYQLLNSAKYYMDNMYQPIDHYKSEGQVLIQTFHGYPFKLMGHQLWEKDGVDAERTVQYDRRANEWNYLVSPAPYATPLLRRDFRYEGEVLEIGYPRNDELLAPDASARRSHVRKKLGIQENVTAVLYAPTFRDSGSSDGHTARFEDILGLEQLAEELGDRYVILLRGHAFHSRVAEQRSRAAQVIDVTDYQHVTDLYHAADVAIVDYSSLRFDFAVTGKPMVFFVPDLVKYKEDRGWVVGFEETAPGPLLTTRAEVAAVLQDLDAVVKDYAEARATFASDFIPLEDGHASARLVDRVFVPRGDVGPA